MKKLLKQIGMKFPGVREKIADLELQLKNCDAAKQSAEKENLELRKSGALKPDEVAYLRERSKKLQAIEETQALGLRGA